jgi:hypothetical protein
MSRDITPKPADSNPRWTDSPYRFSRPAHSTALPPLRWGRAKGSGLCARKSPEQARVHDAPHPSPHPVIGASTTLEEPERPLARRPGSSGAPTTLEESERPLARQPGSSGASYTHGLADSRRRAALAPAGRVVLAPAGRAALAPAGRVVLAPAGRVVLAPAGRVVLLPVGGSSYRRRARRPAAGAGCPTPGGARRTTEADPRTPPPAGHSRPGAGDSGGARRAH